MQRRPSWQIGLALLAGMLAVSLGSILVRLAGPVPPLTIAFYRLAIASLLLSPLAFRPGQKPSTPMIPNPQPTPRAFAGRTIIGRLHLGAGLFLAFHFACWIASLGETTVALSVVITNSAPILVAGVSVFLFRERLTLLGILGILAAFAGTWLLFGVGMAAGEMPGILLALGGAIGLAGYLVAGRQVRREAGLIEYVFPCYVVASLALLLLVLVSGAPLYGFSRTTWLCLFLLGLIPQGVGHTVYNWALGFLPATVVAVLILAEPLLAPLLGWWILGEAISASILPGSALILLGIVLVSGWGVHTAERVEPNAGGNAGAQRES